MPFRVGEEVHYILSGDGRYRGIVREEIFDHVLIEVTDPNFHPRGALRSFNQSGQPATWPEVRLRNSAGSYGSRIEPIVYHSVAVAPCFQVGQQANYHLSSGEDLPGEVVETTDEFVLFSTYTGSSRYFTQSGEATRDPNPFTRGQPANYNSRLIPITTEEPQPMFTCGQQIRYHYESGIAEGYISEISADHILVELTFPDGRTGTRALHPDGRGPPRNYHWSTHAPRVAYITPAAEVQEWRPTPGREYPSEPIVSYGVFDVRGRQIEAGHSGATAYAGFGILNLPRAMRSMVFESADDAVLKEYLRQAKVHWLEECLSEDFNAVENRLDFLIGLQLKYMEIGGDSMWIEFELERRRSNITFDYSLNGLSAGPMPRGEISEHIRNRTVMHVEGDKVVLDDAFEFRLMSHSQPVLNVSHDVRAMLMRNLAMQRATEDSGLALAA